MTNQEIIPLSKTLNVDHLALIVDARKITGLVFGLATEAKRGLTPEECECLAAVNRLIDECAETCLEHLYAPENQDQPPENANPTD